MSQVAVRADSPERSIFTPRLELRPMTHAFLDASAEGDGDRMTRILGATVPPDWPGDAPIALWLERSAVESDLPWLARAIVLRADGAMIGHAGFHLPPGATELERWAPGGVELGYTVFEAYRRRGYAAEAVEGLLAFAAERGVRTILATTEVTNHASMAVLRRCGFRRSYRVEQDGVVEDVWIHGD